jgi:hypothetical protein
MCSTQGDVCFTLQRKVGANNNYMSPPSGFVFFYFVVGGGDTEYFLLPRMVPLHHTKTRKTLTRYPHFGRRMK